MQQPHARIIAAERERQIPASGQERYVSPRRVVVFEGQVRGAGVVGVGALRQEHEVVAMYCGTVNGEVGQRIGGGLGGKGKGKGEGGGVGV